MSVSTIGCVGQVHQMISGLDLEKAGIGEQESCIVPATAFSFEFLAYAVSRLATYVLSRKVKTGPCIRIKPLLHRRGYVCITRIKVLQIRAQLVPVHDVTPRFVWLVERQNAEHYSILHEAFLF